MCNGLGKHAYTGKVLMYNSGLCPEPPGKQEQSLVRGVVSIRDFQC